MSEQNQDRLVIFLPREAREKAKALARENGLSLSAYIRMIVLTHLKGIENEKP